MLQLLFGIFLLNGDLTISFKSFVELVPDVPFHAVCSKNITDAADMSPVVEVWSDYLIQRKHTHTHTRHLVHFKMCTT